MKKSKEKYWVVGGAVVKSAKEPFAGAIVGPFDTVEKASDCARLNRWRFFTHSPMQESLYGIFMEACGRWYDPNEVRAYLHGLGGKLLLGTSAAEAVGGEQPTGQVVFHVSTHDFTGDFSPFSPDGEPPIAIVLPEDVALKIVALGGIP